MKYKSILLSFFFPISGIFAQASRSVNPLVIGDEMPNQIINNIVNYKSGTAKISDFRGKVLIFDFFSTWCGACIEELPRLDSIQRELKGKLQILVVTTEKKERIISFLKKNPNVKGLTLPFVTQDTLLQKYFPHKLIPHDVWIDKRGEIVAITEGYYVTTSSLNLLMNGGVLHLPVKSDVMDFDPGRTLDEDNNRSLILYQSTFTRYENGVSAIIGIENNQSRMRFFGFNQAILSLYSAALPLINNRMVLEVKDPSRYIKSDSVTWDRWAKDNCYCYELITPPGTSTECLHKLMLQDLNRYLCLDGRMEKRIEECWALVNNHSGTELFRTRGGTPIRRFYNKKDSIKILRNVPLSDLLEAVNYQTPGQPIRPVVINETGYSGNIDMNLNLKDIQNLSSLKKALFPYGLDLIKVTRKLEMFVLTDNKP